MMHIFHDWSKWEWAMDSAGKAFQTKRCTVCGKYKVKPL